MGGHNMAVGRWGEDRAVAHLRNRGYEILARNWRSASREAPGEIDLIAAKDGVAVVCEVKTRLGATFGDPIEAVSSAQVRRLRRLAGLWLARRDADPKGTPQRVREVRFDVIAVRGDPDDPTLDVVQHVAGAF